MCPFCDSPCIKKIIETPSWSINSCLNCTNAWTLPSPKKIEYDRQDFHSKDKIITIEELPLLWKKAIQMQVKLLLKHLKPGAKILEIGCGQGLLLNELKKNGFNATGIEPSKSAAQKAMEKGLDVKTGYFPDCLLPSQQFDAFIMSHVLEHIKNPEKIIYEIKKIAPNGILMLIQSNWRGLIPKIYKSRWYAWVPEHHYWHFTPKGLEIYLKKFNIKKLDLEFSSLVHPKNTIFFLANFIPKERDQFHILFKIN